MQYKDDPREITVKYNCKCQECGKELKKGEKAIYYPKGKAMFCINGKQAEEFRAWLFDVNVLGCDY